MHNQSNIHPITYACPWLKHYDAGVEPQVENFTGPLFSLLDQAAKTHPTNLACIFQNTKINYQQLKDKAEIFAASLRLMGINHGDRVAVMLPNVPQAMIAFWGIMKAGAIAVMINPLYMETEIIHHLHDSGAKCLILLDLLWPKINPLRSRLSVEKFVVTGIADALSFPLNYLYIFKEKRDAKHIHIDYDKSIIAWKSMFSNKEKYSAQNTINENSVALLQYTGGTTGIPKGVMLTHQNIGTNCRQIISIIHEIARQKHTFVAILPFFHVYGLSVGLIIPTALKACVLPLPRYVPQDVLKLIKKHKPTILPGAPAIYVSLMQQKNIATYNLRSIKLCISGSAPLPEEHYRRFQELTGANIIEGYGLTEASPITHISPVTADKHKIGSIGLPIPSTEARIVDMEGGSLTLPAGKLGELVIRGPQVMVGYWNRPDATASALRNGWLYTGDLATMDEDGFFHIMDRKKDMIIVMGYNVYPREIDEVLLEHPHILDAVAVGIPDAQRGEVIKAYIVLMPDKKLNRAEVIAWCRTKLANYKVPRMVEFRESLPKTIVGKVLRRMLREEEIQKNNKDNSKLSENPSDTPEISKDEKIINHKKDEAIKEYSQKEENIVDDNNKDSKECAS